MQYVIRLQRKGRKKRPYFLIVVQPKLKGVQSNPLAILGSYNMFFGKGKGQTDDPEYKLVFINRALLNEWLLKGARPSATVLKLLFV